MLHALKGNGFDCLFTLVSIKMDHPRPLQVCTNVCIIFAHTGAGVIRVKWKIPVQLALLIYAEKCTFTVSRKKPYT